ncbi:hypothetical protein L1987_42420 [Smallanthus sonchifolius]|uniref:Uncharacterized protein n=1 Tax=Smallanthus sonchifolius TaxID=185202 RepID=A0ACB9GK17_9ASTR|nr:hypothetical protein L1987_42420 [Smallanthus sonchifolius]
MVKGTLKKIVCPCWKPSFVEGDGEGGGEKADSGGHVDELWWYKDSGKHVNGEFSIAMIQANLVLEDQCELESGSLKLGENGPFGTFVGIYDGHAGPEAARFINDRLFDNFKKYTAESEEMSADIIRNALLATEEEFLTLVESEWLSAPKMASVGSCCLTGIICNGVLYIANAGDSRAVLVKEEDKSINALRAVRISEEHNASFESVRQELRSLHPNDPEIVVLKHNVWRVRGFFKLSSLDLLQFYTFGIMICKQNFIILQISRSIGDAYLKKAEFNKPPLLPKFRQSVSFSEPILKAEPAILVQRLTAEDQFLIFASDGLWEHLSDQEAVDIVKSSPRDGIARELVKAAVVEAAKKQEMSYSDLEKVGSGLRRRIHDDITVIVLFLNCHSPTQTSFGGPMMLSVKSPFSF